MLSWRIPRDALDATMNYGAHVKFVTKWLEKLDTEGKQPSGPRPVEPGLVTAPGLATGPDPATEPPIVGTAHAFNVPGGHEPPTQDIHTSKAQDNADREKLLKVAQAMEA